MTWDVDTADKKPNSQSTTLSIESTRNMLSHVFRGLDTPREREVLNFIEENGRSKSVIERDDLVEKLVEKSGEAILGMTDQNRASQSDIELVKNQLRRELMEDVGLVMNRNRELFDRKLEGQGERLVARLEKQGEYIRKVLGAKSAPCILNDHTIT